MRRYKLAALSAIPAMLALAACQTLLPLPADPVAVALASSIESRSADFYSALAATSAPDCAYAANTGAYDDLEQLARELQDRFAPSAPLHRAAAALAQAIAAARLSHEKASQVTTDPAGPCLAPGAIALNAEAIARAGRAIAASQQGQD